VALLDVRKLTVRFGGLTAVDGFDCAVEAGKIFSVIGPNGAGKTTVFNAITGIYEPTDGAIEFAGKPLQKPFSWRSVVLCMVAGLLTGLGVALACVNVDKLWRAAIKRNYGGPGESFSISTAGHEALAYLRGELALERVRGGRWSVVTTDGTRTLGYAETAEKAADIRDHLNQLIALKGSTDTLEERDGKWVVRDAVRAAPAGSGATIATYDSREAAIAILQRMAAIGREQDAIARNGLIGLIVGMALGSTGAYVVWRRARRTPDVISHCGLARTFQNIRLFQNMTVLDNVLTGMDRRFRAGVTRMALRTPGVRRQEREGRRRAEDLLAFVGLSGRSQQLAKNLPYGDQRRLEIARALATEPRLILLDEPAAGMNPAESVDLTGLIEAIRRRGLAVLLIEHHMRVVMGISDRIAVLDYGIKIAEGSPEEVRKNPAVIQAYLGSEEVS